MRIELCNNGEVISSFLSVIWEDSCDLVEEYKTTVGRYLSNSGLDWDWPHGQRKLLSGWHGDNLATYTVGGIKVFGDIDSQTLEAVFEAHAAGIEAVTRLVV
jgi:hypothetical protein